MRYLEDVRKVICECINENTLAKAIEPSPKYGWLNCYIYEDQTDQHDLQRALGHCFEEVFKGVLALNRPAEDRPVVVAGWGVTREEAAVFMRDNPPDPCKVSVITPYQKADLAAFALLHIEKLKVDAKIYQETYRGRSKRRLDADDMYTISERAKAAVPTGPLHYLNTDLMVRFRQQMHIMQIKSSGQLDLSKTKGELAELFAFFIAYGVKASRPIFGVVTNNQESRRNNGEVAITPASYLHSDLVLAEAVLWNVISPAPLGVDWEAFKSMVLGQLKGMKFPHAKVVQPDPNATYLRPVDTRENPPPLEEPRLKDKIFSSEKAAEEKRLTEEGLAYILDFPKGENPEDE